MKGYSKTNNKLKLLKGIIWVLLAIVIVLLLLLLTLYINDKIAADSIIYSSPFVGSLLGALITGGLAIFISNIEHRRLRKKDKEKSEKNYKLVRQYLSLMLYEFNIIIKEWNRFGEIPPAYELHELGDGNVARQQLVSSDEEKQLQNQKDKINEEIAIKANEIITYSTYLFEIKVNDLESNILDKYLKINSNIRTYAMPIIKELRDKGASSLSEEQIKVIKRLFIFDL